MLDWQRYLYGRRVSLSPRRMKWLDEQFLEVKHVLGGNVSSSHLRASADDDRWQAKCSEVTSFIRAHGRLPHRPTRNATENSLWGWLNSQRKWYRHRGFLSPQRAKWLDEQFLEVKHVLKGNVSSSHLWSSAVDDHWHAKCSEVTSFIRAHGRLPHGWKRNATERSLKKLPDSQRYPYGRRVSLSSRRMKWLDEQFLEVKHVLESNVSSSHLWASGCVLRWHAKCSEVTPFIRTHGRLPQWSKRNAAEYSLRKWLAAQRQLYRRRGFLFLSPQRTTWLDEQFVEGKHVLEGNVSSSRLCASACELKHLLEGNLSSLHLRASADDDRWHAKCSEVTYFIRAHRRLPHSSKRNATKRSLHYWLDRQRRLYGRRGSLSPQFTKWLDGQFLEVKHVLKGNVSSSRLCASACELKHLLEGNLSSSHLRASAADDHWHAKCSEVTSYIRTHGRLPQGAKRNAAEYSLRKLLVAQRLLYRRRGFLSPQCTTWLDEQFVEVKHVLEGNVSSSRLWASAADDRWHAKCSEVISFIRAHGRLPQGWKRNATERSFKKWLDSQRYLYGRRVSRSFRRMKWLDEQFVEVKHVLAVNTSSSRLWAFDLFWHAKCSEVTQFIRTHGRWPHMSTRNATETSLRKWLDVQRSYRRRGFLSPQRTTWLDEQFVEVKHVLEGNVSSSGLCMSACELKKELKGNMSSSHVRASADDDRWHVKCSEVTSLILTHRRLLPWSERNATAHSLKN